MKLVVILMALVGAPSFAAASNSASLNSLIGKEISLVSLYADYGQPDGWWVHFDCNGSNISFQSAYPNRKIIFGAGENIMAVPPLLAENTLACDMTFSGIKIYPIAGKTNKVTIFMPRFIKAKGENKAFMQAIFTTDATCDVRETGGLLGFGATTWIECKSDKDNVKVTFIHK